MPPTFEEQMYKTISFLMAFLMATPVFAQSDVFQLDQLTRADIVAIQRGWQSNISQCAIDVYQEITIDAGVGMLWVIIADSESSTLSFERLDGTNKVICQQDGRREIGTGIDGSQTYDNLVPY